MLTPRSTRRRHVIIMKANQRIADFIFINGDMKTQSYYDAIRKTDFRSLKEITLIYALSEEYTTHAYGKTLNVI